MEDILSTNIPPLSTNGNEESQNFSSEVTSDGYKQQALMVKAVDSSWQVTGSFMAQIPI